MKIVWTRPAIAHLKEAAAYIKIDNPGAAVRVAARIRSSIARLATFPMLGRAGWKEGTRELAIPTTPYIVVYKVEDNRVIILAVLHGATDWKQVDE